MENLVFLKNGQACYLKEKIGGKFIVNKIFEYQDEEDYHEVVDENDIVVDCVFTKQPIEKISSEVKELHKQKSTAVKELQFLRNSKSKAQYELDQITKTLLTKNKFIINRSDLINAESLVLFEKDKIMPIRKDKNEKSFRGLKVTMEVKISDGEERFWGYKLYDDSGYNSGNFLCPKYGVMINPTDEEVNEVIIKRLSEFEFSDYHLKGMDDKYLTKELIEKRDVYSNNLQAKEKENLENELKKIQDRLEKLNAK
jgi:hypothetical protein